MLSLHPRCLIAPQQPVAANLRRKDCHSRTFSLLQPESRKGGETSRHGVPLGFDHLLKWNTDLDLAGSFVHSPQERGLRTMALARGPISFKLSPSDGQKASMVSRQPGCVKSTLLDTQPEETQLPLGPSLHVGPSIRPASGAFLLDPASKPRNPPAPHTGPTRFGSPSRAIHFLRLHDLLLRGLATEVPQLTEVVVEGVLPGHLPRRACAACRQEAVAGRFLPNHRGVLFLGTHNGGAPFGFLQKRNAHISRLRTS